MTRDLSLAAAPRSRTILSSAALLEHLAESGLHERSVAETALRATLSVIAERLTDDEAIVLEACLPESLARVVARSEPDDIAQTRDFDASAFYERARRREKLGAGIVREHVNIVLQVLGVVLDDEVLRILARALPGDLADKLVPLTYGAPPPHPRIEHAPAIATLAHGRPGSRHPLAEGAVIDGHVSSLARNQNPHHDTKLSSARGLTQERLDETLAAGRPPHPLRSVAEADDE